MPASSAASHGAESPVVLVTLCKPAPEAVRDDAVLSSLVARGHGLDAISAFLHQSREQIIESVVRLNLSTPHDRPFRARSGPKAWNPADYPSFILDWISGLHAESIGKRFGRSAGAVWSKARWFGLPKRSRRSVFRAEADAAPHRIPDKPPAQPVEELCRSVVTASGSMLTVRQLPKRNQIFWTPEVDAELANRYWANQHHLAIAREWGVSSGAIRSRATRLQLPPRERSELVHHYDPSVIEGNKRTANYVLRECRAVPGWFFWAHRNGERISRRGKRMNARKGRFGFVTDYSIGCDVSTLGL